MFFNELFIPVVLTVLGVVTTRLCTANAPGKFREANFDTLIPLPIRYIPPDEIDRIEDEIDRIKDEIE